MVTQQVLIGHRTASGWSVDAAVSNPALNATADLKLGVSIKGSTISVTLNDQAAVGFVYNAVGADGRFGLFSKGTSASFDSVKVSTNDPAAGTDTGGTTLPAVSVTATDAAGAETNQDPIVFTVGRSANLAGDIVVNLAWSGAAVLGTDYTLSASGGVLSADRSTLTLAANVASATITATPVDDTAIESPENVTLTLTAGTGYTVGTPSADTGTIADNDLPPTLSIAPASVTEGNVGTKTIAVTVTLSAPRSTTVTVGYATANGTATAGTDYQSATGTLTFAPGVTSRTFNVTIIGDRVKEPNETFQVVLSNAVGAAIGTGSATVTIVDDEKALTAAQAAGTASLAQVQTQAAGTAEPTAAPSQADLQLLAGEALRRMPLNPAQRALLGSVSVRVIDLPGMALGEYRDGAVLIDADAAGYGWFVDSTPGDDAEFSRSGDALLAAGVRTAGAPGVVMPVTLARFDESAFAALPSAARAVSEDSQPRPVIDWSSGRSRSEAASAASATKWLGDFVNHLGKTEAQRNPNAALRLQIDVAPKVVPRLSALAD